jgi:hypothetical protein
MKGERQMAEIVKMPLKFHRKDLIRALAIIQADLWHIAGDNDKGVYTEDGYREIASHAQDVLDDALATLGISDIVKEEGGEVFVGVDYPNWKSGREHNDIRTPEWQSGYDKVED